MRDSELARVLPRLRELRIDPPLVNADVAFTATVAAETARLWRFYDAGLSTYERNYDRWARAIRTVMQEDGRNPYYRWAASPQ